MKSTIHENQSLNKSMSKKIYIAGKITNEPFHHVVIKFKEAQTTIEKLGFEVVNPIVVVNNSTEPWESAMKTCLKAMLDCDGIVILPCWQLSRGAQIERQLAEDLDMMIFNYDSFGLKVLKARLCNNSQPLIQ
ncbi:DUF4406 domain-containing protein [Flavobacterium geliluteum]|uniref:DUF4406 domain-containing protein n=1 Tax=Flavobacterium geliluteum TaxID=2816120 RepID=A0A941AYY4_9FLAO|nr:DUF4406 domain-containing protein [Flavobacterium geliluteum]MBP4139976.1 DUF4406 domain-containing protein [Flavobacterium geliluteum]